MNPVILYVEDDLENREIMQILVKDVMGLTELTIFEDSKDFMQRVEALSPQPEVILLDIHVLPHTGFEMLKMLRNHDTYREIPVAALTASVMNEEVKQLKEAGFDGVIAKPLDMDSFPEMLQRIMQGENVWHIIG